MKRTLVLTFCVALLSLTGCRGQQEVRSDATDPAVNQSSMVIEDDTGEVAGESIVNDKAEESIDRGSANLPGQSSPVTSPDGLNDTDDEDAETP